MKKFKKSLELNKEFVNNISSEELESLMAEFDKYEKSIQLMQTAVVGQGEQLVLFAEWLQYNGKYQLPEEQVKSFLKQQ